MQKKSDMEIELYKILYLKDGMTETKLDYQKLVKCYLSYIHRISISETEFYMDTQLLQIVVDGFAYYHDIFFKDEGVSEEEKISSFVEQGESLETKFKQTGTSGKYDMDDYVYMATHSCIEELVKQELDVLDVITIDQMIDNAGKVNKVYAMSKKGGN